MDEGAVAGYFIFAVLLLLEIMLYAFGSAIQSLNVNQLSESDNKKELNEKILKIKDEPQNYVNMTQFLTVLIHLSMGGFFLARFQILFQSIPQIGARVALYLAALVLLACLLVLGVMVPKKLGQKYAFFFVKLCIRPVKFFLYFTSPFVFLFDRLSDLVLLLFGIRLHEGDTDVTEEEIISMVNEGQEQGVLLESEAQMITNIFEFTDKDAKDIMTHRSNIIAIDASTSLKKAVEFMLSEKNSRYPVYIDNIDHIIGIIHLKDACRALDNAKNEDKPIKSIRNLIREAKFIPETRNIDSLFRSMQSLKTHMVIVIDEYGQTAGLIAMEDILEEIVGNILDEYDEDDSFIMKKGEDTYEIEGLTPLDELGEMLDIDFSKEEFETLSGLMIAHLEHIPTEDDLFDMDYDRYNFKVLSVQNKVIKNVLVTKKAETESLHEGEE